MLHRPHEPAERGKPRPLRPARRGRPWRIAYQTAKPTPMPHPPLTSQAGQLADVSRTEPMVAAPAEPRRPRRSRYRQRPASGSKRENSDLAGRNLVLPLVGRLSRHHDQVVLGRDGAGAGDQGVHPAHGSVPVVHLVEVPVEEPSGVLCTRQSEGHDFAVHDPERGPRRLVVPVPSRHR